MQSTCIDTYLMTDSKELAHVLFENSLSSILTGVSLVQALVNKLQETEEPAKLIEGIRLLISATVNKINDLQTYEYEPEMIGSTRYHTNRYQVISALRALVESLEYVYRAYNSERVLSEGLLFPARIVRRIEDGSIKRNRHE